MTYGTLSGGYSGFAKLLHWLIAICVLATIPVAFWMNNAAPGPLQDNLYNFHKSVGVLILILMVVRIVRRWTGGAPAPEATIVPWQRAVSSAVHGSLYALLLAMPIVGYLANSAYGASTPFFGLFNIPPMIGNNENLANQLFLYHRWAGFAVAALAALHIAAALQHYFILKDGVLQRMLPRALGGV